MLIQFYESLFQMFKLIIGQQWFYMKIKQMNNIIKNVQATKEKKMVWPATQPTAISMQTQNIINM